ncbi:MAG: DUF4140 domain-containing protein [Kiritimatiellia bacterium]
MKHMLSYAAMLFSLWCVWPVVAAPALLDAEEGIAATSKIVAVTVYADRASVVRTATVELAPGVQKFAFRKLPGWIDEGSVPNDMGKQIDMLELRLK